MLALLANGLDIRAAALNKERIFPIHLALLLSSLFYLRLLYGSSRSNPKPPLLSPHSANAGAQLLLSLAFENYLSGYHQVKHIQSSGMPLGM